MKKRINKLFAVTLSSITFILNLEKTVYAIKEKSNKKSMVSSVCEKAKGNIEELIASIALIFFTLGHSKIKRDSYYNKLQQYEKDVKQIDENFNKDINGLTDEHNLFLVNAKNKDIINAKNEELNEKIKNLNKSLEESKKILNGKIIRLKENIFENSENIRSLEVENGLSKENIRKGYTKINEVNLDINKFKIECENKIKELEISLNNKVLMFELEISETEEDCERSESNYLVESVKKLEEQENLLKEQKNKHENLIIKIEGIYREIEEKNLEIDQLNSAINNSDYESKKAEIDLIKTSYDKKINLLKVDITNLKEELNILNNKILEKENFIKEIENNHAEYIRKIKEIYELKFNAKVEKFKEIEDNITDMESEIAVLKNEIKEKIIQKQIQDEKIKRLKSCESEIANKLLNEKSINSEINFFLESYIISTIVPYICEIIGQKDFIEFVQEKKEELIEILNLKELRFVGISIRVLSNLLFKGIADLPYNRNYKIFIKIIEFVEYYISNNKLGKCHKPEKLTKIISSLIETIEVGSFVQVKVDNNGFINEDTKEKLLEAKKLLKNWWLRRGAILEKTKQ
ncbi:MAG: hypothetical protein FWC41_13510 [Firmicutes bacterium]|nr:hypothetical protein [Bacillota bacterium]